jgi:hypothetical protein
VDRILRFGLRRLIAARPLAQLQQRRIEQTLLSFRVEIHQRAQPLPDRAQYVRIFTSDLLQHRKQPALLMMIVKNELGDIHA